MNLPSIQKMIAVGMHFGHQISKRHPKMQPYIFGARKGVHIINLDATLKKLEDALGFAKDLAQKGKTILFAGTKRQAAPLIEKFAKECGMPFVSHRWLGGTLTNFHSLRNSIRRHRELKSMKEKGELSRYTKKEQGKIEKEMQKMEVLLGGITALEKSPDAIFIVDLKKDKTAFIEAVKTRVPVIAICDTNTDPSRVAYPIPANDDSVGSLEMIISLVAEAVKEGKSESKEKKEEKEKVK